MTTSSSPGEETVKAPYRILGVYDPSDPDTEHLKPKLDPHNANLGTTRGAEVIRRSMEKYGAARGVAMDRNLVDLAGNKTLQEALLQGKKVLYVETEGDVILATVRSDWDVEQTPDAREYAVVDNRSNELNLSWDYAELVRLSERPELDLGISFSSVELEDFEAHLHPPSLDALEEEYGQPQEDDYFNPFKLDLPQELIDAYYALVADIHAAPHEKFARVLAWAATGKEATRAEAGDSDGESTGDTDRDA